MLQLVVLPPLLYIDEGIHRSPFGLVAFKALYPAHMTGGPCGTVSSMDPVTAGMSPKPAELTVRIGFRPGCSASRMYGNNSMLIAFPNRNWTGCVNVPHFTDSGLFPISKV